MRYLKVILAVLAFAISAFATDLTFNSTGSNSWGGYYTYPYNFTVQGQGDEQLMCVTYDAHITPGESWHTTSESVASYGNNIGSLQQAEELAWLYEAAAANGGDPSTYNAAAWYINAAHRGTIDISGDPNVIALVATVEGLDLSKVDFNHIQFYVPNGDDHGWTDGVPQTFVGDPPTATPEPSTLLMMGSGLIGLAGLARKRLFS